MDSVKKAFARNFSRLLNESGKTQKEFAEIVCVAPATVNGWTQGKILPNSDKLELIAEYFRVDVGELVTFLPKHNIIPPHFVTMISRLNDDGLHKLEEYLADLADMEKYTKK